MGRSVKTSRQDQGGGLFLGRTEKFARLRSAVSAQPITGKQRENLFRVVEMLELKTIENGFCRLTREELAGALNWSPSRFDRARQSAEDLGWIEVDRTPRRGGQAANRVRVSWERIRADRNDEAPSQNDEAHNKDLNSKGSSKQIEPLVPAGGDGSLQRFSWGRELSRQDLSDPLRLLGLFPCIVAAGIARDCEMHRFRFFAWAAEVDRTWRSQRNPVGNFTQRFLSADRYGRTWLERGSAKVDEDRARRLIAAIRAPPAVTPDAPIPVIRGPDEPVRRRSVDEQKRLLIERGLLVGAAGG